jgi:phospholipid-translocating ATPase
MKHHAASISLVNRDDQLSAVYEEIEAGMMLIGATAIEDKLQDGVPEAIANLARAGIKIWVLTGDKQETAINIGYSCKLLTDEMAEIYVIDADSFEGVKEQLSKAKQDMLKRMNTAGTLTRCEESTLTLDTASVPNGLDAKVDPASFAIIINGHSLVHGLKSEMELLLLETGCMCKAVICCRVTPLQKALVVDLIKRHKKTVTLAIGDGANDVSMIKMAHIGVGISGQEGMQAVLASDYSLAQFCYLERLLLVHGRWSYLRMCKFLKYFFYKNFAFTLCHFWFAFFCGFSAQTLYDQYFITLYNVIYTSTPILVLGFLDQDVNDEYSLRYPKLYAPGHLDLWFNKKVFAQSAAEGVVTSLVLFFVPYATFHESIQPSGVDLGDHQALGTVVAGALVIVVTLRCGIETSYWTGINHLFIWGSILCYYAIMFIMYTDYFQMEYVGVAVSVLCTANYWFTILLCVIILLVPIIAERFYYVDTRPTLTDKVRAKQRKLKPRRRAGERIVRRASTLRRSQRSVGRSGYAFSHQEGFAELITSGSMMIRSDSTRPSTARRNAPAAVENVTITSPNGIVNSSDKLNDSGVRSASEGSVATESEVGTTTVVANVHSVITETGSNLPPSYSPEVETVTIVKEDVRSPVHV